jgi:hypothetical protein
MEEFCPERMTFDDQGERRFLSVFFAPPRYRVVKITCSYSKMVLRATKHTIVYLGLGPSLEVITLHSVV